ncbi:MAG: hypothetical protein DYH20_13490 [Gammaproteobacteria bacterium PRO9]|nr:hypothetical protein [Gammaproteobacteria bacterium PRO9]
MKLHWNQAAGAMLGFAVVAAVQPVWAQEIPEIVVTARKQGEEKLMETPLAITAFDANAIENRNITNMQDVANLTPGLSFYNPLGENLPTPVIRGIVPQNIFGENAAAVFVDGVYVSGREGLNFSQLDIERIEVLKGPQSSTYGRNAFSGAINYVTKGPSDVFESKFEGEVGNRDRRKVSGQISGPILGELLGNTLTGRVAALYDDWDGSYDNTLAPQNDIGGYRYRSYMGKLRWLPADDLDVNFSIYRSNDEIDEAAVGGRAAAELVRQDPETEVPAGHARRLHVPEPDDDPRLGPPRRDAEEPAGHGRRPRRGPQQPQHRVGHRCRHADLADRVLAHQAELGLGLRAQLRRYPALHLLLPVVELQPADLRRALRLVTRPDGLHRPRGRRDLRGMEPGNPLHEPA